MKTHKRKAQLSEGRKISIRVLRYATTTTMSPCHYYLQTEPPFPKEKGSNIRGLHTLNCPKLDTPSPKPKITKLSNPTNRPGT